MKTDLDATYALPGLKQTTARERFPRPVEAEPLTVQPLADEHEAEVLAFLGERSAQTFTMTGFIHSNGLISLRNRGTFYGCRDSEGQLQGVALIGHFILFETRSEAAIKAFACTAQECSNAFMLLGEQEAVQSFWGYYSQGGQPARLFCRELLMEQRWPVKVHEQVAGLRLAGPGDLDLIVPAHAQLAFDESGVDPLRVDPVRFRQRCAHRIEEGKTWVWIEDGKLLFKAEVITDTPEVIYLEGVWVDPQERGKGYGIRCIAQLTRNFLLRTESVCLLVNDKFKVAQGMYRKAGYKLTSYYDTIFLQSEH